MKPYRRASQHDDPDHGAGKASKSGEYRITGEEPTRHEPRRRTSRANIAAVRPAKPRSSAHTIDEHSLDFAFDEDSSEDETLELECAPSSHRSNDASIEPPPPPGVMRPPAPAWPMASSVERPTSSKSAISDTYAALVAFAGFGDPPAGFWGTPEYAVRVIARKRSLRSGLALARQRNSPDVSLYEASLRTADDGAVRNGVIVIALLTAIGILLGIAVFQMLSGVFSDAG